jgi:hypothetical protein
MSKLVNYHFSWVGAEGVIFCCRLLNLFTIVNSKMVNCTLDIADFMRLNSLPYVGVNFYLSPAQVYELCG